jgi:hypothetical protein
VRVALYTFGVFREPSADPVNAGFHDRNDLNFAAAEASHGFIARAGYDDEPSPWGLWGAKLYPEFYEERGDGWSPATLSLWEDLESPYAFSYSGIHAEALKHGRSWFVKPRWPPYALWWVAGDHVPHWEEAVLRHKHLHVHGPTPYAFDFKIEFGPDGNTRRMNRDRVEHIKEMNAERQRQLATVDTVTKS